MRHILGILGVASAAVLLAVSAGMNWRFGYSLGKTELDGQLYGAASAAADCLKALVPFFFFAALKNRMWSQVMAAIVVGVVVCGYSLTSELGYSAVNRLDTAGQRSVGAQSYKDLRADLDRARGELKWVPEHRPVAAVQADIDGLKTKREWELSLACADIKGKSQRDTCGHYHELSAELASAQQGNALTVRVDTIEQKLEVVGTGVAVMAEADPQAKVLGDLTGFSIDKVQVAMTIIVALLLEVGSSLGMYVACAQWKLYDALAMPMTPAMPISAPMMAPIALAAAPAENDNEDRFDANNVNQFFLARLAMQDGQSMTALDLFEEYQLWCSDEDLEPLTLVEFAREIDDLGIHKAKIGGRIRYIGVTLKVHQLKAA